MKAVVIGDLSDPDTRVEAWREVIERCRKDDYIRLLVVQDSTGTKTEVDAFISSKGIVGLGLARIKIAFVDFDPAHHEINKFCELVAVNRGADARAFIKEEPAVDWLLSNGTELENSIEEAAEHLENVQFVD